MSKLVANKRGSSKRRRERRMRIREKMLNVCALCTGQMGEAIAEIHVKAMGVGGRSDRANRALVCAHCAGNWNQMNPRLREELYHSRGKDRKRAIVDERIRRLATR